MHMCLLVHQGPNELHKSVMGSFLMFLFATRQNLSCVTSPTFLLTSKDLALTFETVTPKPDFPSSSIFLSLQLRLSRNWTDRATFPTPFQNIKKFRGKQQIFSVVLCYQFACSECWHREKNKTIVCFLVASQIASGSKCDLSRTRAWMFVCWKSESISMPKYRNDWARTCQWTIWTKKPEWKIPALSLFVWQKLCIVISLIKRCKAIQKKKKQT